MKKKKIVKIFSKIVFFDFPKFFSVEIFHMMSTLRMQNFSIIGQGVPEIQGVTHRLRMRIYYIDVISLLPMVGNRLQACQLVQPVKQV